MAIRIANIKDIGGKRVQNRSQLDVARQVEELLAKAGIEGDVSISRFYADRWYNLEQYERLLEDGL